MAFLIVMLLALALTGAYFLAPFIEQAIRTYLNRLSSKKEEDKT